MKEPNIILASEAARLWKCSGQLVYNALADGRLTEFKMGRHRMVVKDKKYREFKIRDFGGRLHAQFKKKSEGK